VTDVNPYIWTHYTLDHLGLSLDIFADQSFLTVRRDGALTTLIQDQGVVRLIVWAGPGQTLESWRERLNVRNEAHFEEEEEAMICGKAARRQTATLTEGGAVGAFTVRGRARGRGSDARADQDGACCGVLTKLPRSTTLRQAAIVAANNNKTHRQGSTVPATCRAEEGRHDDTRHQT